jgi:hypothetical protein
MEDARSSSDRLRFIFSRPILVWGDADDFLELAAEMKFDAGFFSSGKAADSVDTGGISGFWQRDMMKKRQAKAATRWFDMVRDF